MNVGYLLTNTAAKFPQKEGIVCDQSRMTFVQFEGRVARLSGAMLKSGLKRGDRVALLFYNGSQFVETYFAAIRIGLVATSVNFRFLGNEIIHILNDSGATALFHGSEFVSVVEAVRDRCPALRLVVCPNGGSRTLDYEEFLSEGRPCKVDPTVTESDQCQLMYTSGTTGRPKGVELNHGNVLWNLINTILGREDRPGQVSVIVGPLYHAAALNNHFTTQVALGGKSVLVSNFDPVVLLSIIEREKVTVISGAPAFYRLLMEVPGAWDFDRSSITKCTVGADKLSQNTKSKLLEFFPNISGVYDVYGCTEATACITILTAEQSSRKHGSSGRSLPFLQARVVDDFDHPLEAGQVGELVCKGPNVMQGYHNQPEVSAEAIKEGWLYTGDLAWMDEEGFFYIVGRKKDMIVSGGENIYPREIENLLLAQPMIADVAVVGESDDLWGESVTAVVVLKKGAILSDKEVIDYCKDHLASYKKPRKVIFTNELPRNASGKVMKGQLRTAS